MKLALAIFLLMTGEVYRGRSQPQNCLSNINELVDLENAVQDYSQNRSYTLCPNSIFTIARLDYSNTPINTTGSSAIPIRPNLEIKCGVNGSRVNSCFVYGGDVQVDATGYFGISNGTSLSVENVIISGVTFTDSWGYSVWATRPGNMTFRDCEFRMNRRALAPVYLDYFDASAPTEQLVASFEGCEFSDNVYFGQPAQTALVVSNSVQNRINISDSVFQGNDLVFNNTLNATNSFLIESSGPLNLERNCFLDNALGVSVAVVYGASLETTNNYGYNSSGGACQFAAIFNTEEQLQNFTPQCLSFDATSCQAGVLATAAPAYPSDSPSMSPSRIPSAVPSSGPSVAPILGASSQPITSTGIPSVSPSIASQMPSFAPSAAPTRKPRSKPNKHHRTRFPTPAPSNFTSASFERQKTDVRVLISAISCFILIFG